MGERSVRRPINPTVWRACRFGSGPQRTEEGTKPVTRGVHQDSSAFPLPGMRFSMGRVDVVDVTACAKSKAGTDHLNTWLTAG